MHATALTRSRRLFSRLWLAAAVASSVMLITLGVLAVTHSSPRLLIDQDPPGGIRPASVSAGGRIEVGRNNCITVGGAALVAPQGSSVSLDGQTLTLAGIGTYRIGEELPQRAGGDSEPLNGAALPEHLRPCGPGRFEFVWG